MKEPATIVTPTVEKTPADAKMVRSFLTRSYRKLPFALPSGEADKQITNREQLIAAGLLKDAAKPETSSQPASQEEEELL